MSKKSKKLDPSQVQNLERIYNDLIEGKSKPGDVKKLTGFESKKDVDPISEIHSLLACFQNERLNDERK